jgi:hypothetical protein
MSSSPEIDAFVEAIRKTVAPVAHMTDDELRAAGDDLPPPMIRLLLGLRENLREYDAAENDRAFGQPHRGHE